MYIYWAIPTQLKCLYFSLQSGAFKMIITMVRMCKCIFKCSNAFSLMKIIFSNITKHRSQGFNCYVNINSGDGLVLNSLRPSDAYMHG